MTDEIQDDNKSTEGNNKPPEQPTNLPGQEEEVKEVQDPDMQKWIEETKDLPNAYKRVKGSREEVERWKKEAEEAKQQQEAWQSQVAQELLAYKEKDPDAFTKLFGDVTPEEAAKEQTETAQAQQIDPQQIARQAAIEARAQIEVESFYERNQQHIKSEDDWKAIQSIALKFVGEKDSEGNPYTIQTALRDATLLRNPSLIGDKAISDHLTSQAKRASAAESSDMPGGAASDPELGPEYDQMAEHMGVRLTPEMKQRIAKRQEAK